MPTGFALCHDAADGIPRAHPAPALTGWPAPVATAPVDATVRLPGSKSVTNRALVLGALAPGLTTLRRPLRARDTELMAAALTALGSPVDTTGDDWTVTGAAPGAPVAAGRVDLGNAGTVARFVPAVAALRRGDVVLDGDPRIRERPAGPLLAALRALGAEIDGDAFPVTVRGRGVLRGGAVTLDASASSQLVSGLLLAGPLMAEGLAVYHDGPPVPSQAHLAMTVAMMRDFGATWVVADAAKWLVAPSGYQPRDVEIEADLSGAGPFLAAAAVTGGVVRIAGWPAETTQPGAAIPDLLAAMGCSYDLTDRVLTLRGGPLTGIDADLRDCPEAAPVLAAVACGAGGPTTLRGIAHLRLQETDRLAALATELTALGATVTDTADGLSIRPGALRGGTFQTYDDHRLVMAAAVLGLVVPGVVVAGVETVGKTMPDFVERWQAMLG